MNRGTYKVLNMGVGGIINDYPDRALPLEELGPCVDVLHPANRKKELEERSNATFYQEDIARYNPLPHFNIGADTLASP